MKDAMAMPPIERHAPRGSSARRRPARKVGTPLEVLASSRPRPLTIHGPVESRPQPRISRTVKATVTKGLLLRVQNSAMAAPAKSTLHHRMRASPRWAPR
ncbi:hypothetical protein [Actinomadura madurae]|uniref:hypothetical protein n=1 Tax=Actinomadura madurae TaxID=1993 RepID=UPI0020D1FA68|nr:hypothetical protein [Actinomadura madurae]MCQ0015424.1 hypothetical protein [Actinomadura madurae]